MTSRRQKQDELANKSITERLKNNPRVPFDFDWKEYIEVNPDLRKKGIDNEMLALRHYIKKGYRIGLHYKKDYVSESVHYHQAVNHGSSKLNDIKPNEKLPGSFTKILPNKLAAWSKHANLRINYEESFQKLLSQLEKDKPFTFIRISDGEYQNLFWKASPDKKVDKHTIDKIAAKLKYLLDTKLSAVLEKRDSNLFIGMQHGTQYDIHFLGELKQYKPVIEENHNSSIFSWAYATDRILELFLKIDEMSNPVIVVGPNYLKDIKEFLIDDHVETPHDYSWRVQERIEKEVFLSIENQLSKGKIPIILYACSVTGKMLIADVFKKHGDKVIQLDVGSNLDPYANVLSRGWHTSEINKERNTEKPVIRLQGASQKAFFNTLGDRVGSKINEELFVYAYCEKFNLVFGKVIDSWDHTDDKSDVSRFELHKSLYRFLGLPQDIEKTFFNNEDVEWVEIKDEYLKAPADELFTDNFIQTIQEKFYQNPENSTRESADKIVVAVHIRRGDVGLNNKLRYSPNSYYLNIIQMIKNVYPYAVINIFSDTAYQDNENVESLDEFVKVGCTLCVDLPVDETWKRMINADILVMSKSSFSWVPALYNKNLVIYQNCWLKKINTWASNEDENLSNVIRDFIILRIKLLKDETSNHWLKRGNIFNANHAQVPVIDVLDDRLRIYFSTRKDGKSLPVYIEVSPDKNMKVIQKQSDYLLDLGKPGSFDWSGVMPTSLVNHDGKKYMYYIGWSRRMDVPYHNTLGLAISNDGISWEKAFDGPVFGTSIKEPGYIGTAEVMIEDGVWKMWYLSCRDWIEHEGIMEPIYDIKYATSKNGIDWDPSGDVAIPLDENEGGLSAARVIKTDDGYEMFFSARKKTGYREIKENSYRIYKASSKDGIKWDRESSPIISTSPFGWDDFMVCYPYVCTYKNQTYMFYNGNGFGKSGIGYAVKQN